MERSIWWMGLCAALAASFGGFSSGCNADAGSESDDSGAAGTLRMNMGALGNRGNRYRLRQGVFQIQGPTARTFSSEDFLTEDRVEQRLPVGDYLIELANGWFLERLTSTGYVQVANASLLSNLAAFTIFRDGVTSVSFQFRVGEEVVDTGNGEGTLEVGVGITEIGSTGGGGTNCGNGTLDAGEQCDDANDDPCDGCAACETHTAAPTRPIQAPALITENTVWCANQSPVHLGGDSVVLQGATLFVGPGVRVEADAGTGIEIRGGLGVHGNSDSPAVFTSSVAAPERGAWDGITVISTSDPIVVEHAAFEHAVSGLRADQRAIIRDTRFSHNTVGLESANRVENSSFINNLYGMAGFVVTIDGCQFQSNGTAAIISANEVRGSTFIENGHEGVFSFVCGSTGCAEHGVAIQTVGRVENSTFLRNDAAIISTNQLENSTLIGNEVAAVSTASLRGSVIADNIIGVVNAFGEVLANTIVRNGEPMRVFGGTQLHANTLCDNGAVDLRANDVNLVDATENWWCTTDPAVISGRIHDVFDDPALGLIVFEPFLTAPAPAAPVDPGPPGG